MTEGSTEFLDILQKSLFQIRIKSLMEFSTAANIDICIGSDGKITLFDADSEYQTNSGISADKAFDILKAKITYKELTGDWI